MFPNNSSIGLNINNSTYTERRSASETAIDLLFYHFNRSEPTYKSQRIKAPRCNCRVQSIKCECSETDIDNNLFYFIESKFLIAGN